jgi:hypothetical protein
MLRDICLETNRYAGSLDEKGRPRGGRGWYPVTVRELKVFLATTLYMGMKKLPNVKAYWAKSEDIFYYNVIAGLFTRKRFMALTRCLHITDPSTYVADNTSPLFDKMHQTRWLIDAIREACKRQWNLGQFITIDETMVRYKGTYCPARQYMPKKPVKWGVKVWCAADSKLKFIYDFDIYCGKSQATLESRASRTEEQNLAHRVVTQLTAGLDNKGHVVVMDNYFTSVGLFRDLERRGIYATGTMRSNRIGVHLDMRKTKEFKRRNHGDLDWFMHESRRMSSVLWKDKMHVLLLSTHAPPVFPGDPWDCTVPRRNGAIRSDIPTSPVLQEYTSNMRGVDVADHLRGNYTTQVRTHKWWHRVFFFLWDVTVTNMYIMYLQILQRLGHSEEGITHLQFRNGLAQALTQNWGTRNCKGSLELPRHLKIHCPRYTTFRRKCVRCRKRCNYYCFLCGWRWMCVKRDAMNWSTPLCGHHHITYSSRSPLFVRQ